MKAVEPDWSEFPLVLGTNPFGWTASTRDAGRILDRFTEVGGRLLDTADSYSAWVAGNVGGESEEIIGDWIRSRRLRDRVLLATKVGRLPSQAGLSAANILAGAERSLQRLGVDYIDLYYAHAPDPTVPVEESIGAFASLVHRGLVRWLGVSNFSGAELSNWLTTARNMGAPLPITVQPHYNLVHRSEYESDLRATALEESLMVFPYFALASGFLTGKYRQASDLTQGERSKYVMRYASPRSFQVLDALEEIALARGESMAAVALAWLRVQPGVTAPIASARNVDQLAPLLASTALELDEAEMSLLDSTSHNDEPL